jgi:hypothetical protein
MKGNRMKDALENIARRSVPENTDLWPNISARLERKSPLMTLRTRPLAAILIALLTLLVLSSAAYALGRMLGYIPGIGLVEQTSSLRTLEASVPLEREDIRVTVMNVIASLTGTSVRFQVEWLTPPPTVGDFDTSCQGTPSLILPDGTILSVVQTTDKFLVDGPGSDAGYGYVMEFAPVPADQSDVTFFYPCINPIVPGPLPRDWQIPIHLIPAPEGMALPVVTMPATEAATHSNPTLPAVDPTHRIAVSIDSFVPMNDGYLLIGSLQWSANDYPAYGVKPIPFMHYLNVLDSTGQEVSWQEIYENVKPQNEEYRSYWAISVLSKNFAPPLMITMNAVEVQIQPVAFQFDAGSAPQAGQSWDIRQDIQIVDSLAHIVKANLISSDGDLNFQVDVQVDANTIGDVHINTPLNQCMGGGGGYPTERGGMLQIYVPICRPDLPPGIVKMQVTGAVLWGQWQVSWQR